MAVNNPPHDRQAYAGAWKLVGRVQPLKGAKYAVRVSHIEPDAVVRNEKSSTAVMLRRAHSHHRLRHAVRELGCVLHQVLQGDAHQVCIGGHPQARLNVPLHGVVWRIALNPGGNFTRHGAEVDRCDVQLGACHT